MAEENSSEICPEPISETKEDDVSPVCTEICPNPIIEPEAAEINFSELIGPIYKTLPESIKKQYQTRLTNNKITSTFSAGSRFVLNKSIHEDEGNAEKAHAIILKVQASYIKKRELCRLKQKEQRDALKTLTKEKLPPVEQVIEDNLPEVNQPEVNQPKKIEIPSDLMDAYLPKTNKQVKPISARERVRPHKLSIEPRQKKSGVLDLFR